MKVQFTAVYDYRPTRERRVTVRYRPDGGADKDGVYTVKRECGLAAVAANKATVVHPPRETADV